MTRTPSIAMLAAILISSIATAQTLESGFVESDREQIYYESTGKGEAVILCHGLGGNHAIWYQQVPTLAQNYRVITWDQRGFGRSTNDAKKASPLTAVADLRNLMDHLAIQKAHIVGQSMGGWAAMGFALDMPQRVLSLTLADTIGGIYTPKIEEAFDEYIQRVMTSDPPDKLPITQHPALGQAIGVLDPAQAFLYKQIGSTAPPPPANMGLLLRQTAWDPKRIPLLRLPVLFIVGQKDEIFPHSMIREAASQVKFAQVRIIEGAGHSPYFEKPKDWNNLLLGFIKRHPE